MEKITGSAETGNFTKRLCAIIMHMEIYTDGSCHTQQKTGAWVALLFIDGEKKIISGLEQNTTHQRMELMALLKALAYLQPAHSGKCLKVFSDSQYVINLPARKEKIVALNFSSKKGKGLQNIDLIQQLLQYNTLFTLEFIKVKAHQKNNGGVNFNREADLLCRKLLREAVKQSLI